jgi:hypothetical protein
VQRRHKLVNGLHQQLALVEALKNNQTYAPKKMRTFTDKLSGERKTIETVKRVKEWFWVGENGKINLAVKYGAKTLPLNKRGANAIECANSDELIKTLVSLKAAVLDGELDDAIAEMSTAIRSRFAK